MQEWIGTSATCKAKIQMFLTTVGIHEFKQTLLNYFTVSILQNDVGNGIK